MGVYVYANSASAQFASSSQGVRDIPRNPGTGMVFVNYNDEFCPAVAFAERPAARRLLSALRDGGPGGDNVVYTTIDDLGYSFGTISKAIGALRSTGCRYVITVPGLTNPIDSSAADCQRLVEFLEYMATLWTDLQRRHSEAVLEYSNKHRPRGRPKFGYKWSHNREGRWMVVRSGPEHRVLRMIVQLHGRGFSGRKIRRYLQRHNVRPVPALNTIYNIVREYAQPSTTQGTTEPVAEESSQGSG